jgi:hypothetical protein
MVGVGLQRSKTQIVVSARGRRVAWSRGPYDSADVAVRGIRVNRGA